ncbi:MAG: caspase family protein [Bacteroidota bacterium]
MPYREEIALLTSDVLHPVNAGKNYLLIIAIDSYKNGIRPLDNAVSDALAFKECLVKNYQFQENHCIELFDENATRPALIELFDELIEKVQSEDNLVFYFAGHGKLVHTIKEGYWLLADAFYGKRDTYLANYEVQKFIRNLKARHVFGIVDSCFSGTLFRRSEPSPPSNLYDYNSRYLLTAGRHEPVEDGFPGEHSPFATCLLEILEKNTQEYLWVGDLCRSVLKNIRFNVDEQTPRGEPLQKVGHQGGEFVFIKNGIKWPPNKKARSISVGQERQFLSDYSSLFKKQTGEEVLFISYAKEDESSKTELKDQLSSLCANNNIKILTDEDVPIGVESSTYIESVLYQADVIIFLLSSNFFRSNRIQNRDVKIALLRHKKREVKLVPIYLRPCFWINDDLAKIQVLPRNKVPISKWSDHDEAWLSIILELNKILK